MYFQRIINDFLIYHALISPQVEIRPIMNTDNQSVAKIIRQVLEDLNVPKVGTAYADKSLDAMFESFQNQGAQYFVVSKNNRLLGGAGIAPLNGADNDICELQKMYFLKEARGHGYGELMMQRCLDFARAQGYTKCYIETMPYMAAAQKLYIRSGFQKIDQPLGDTGHYSCTVWFLKTL